MKIIKPIKKYNQTKDKKKKCPKCNGFVFNATSICKLKHTNQLVCGHKFISRKQEIFIKVINDIILSIENNLNYNDITNMSELSKYNHLRCLSPYEAKKKIFISYQDSENLKYMKPINLVKLFNKNNL